MRLHLYLQPSGAAPVPFHHLPALVSAFHGWLGHHNAVHDGLSLYSFSWLQGGRAARDGLRFAEGARWFISAPDDALIHQLVGGIIRQPELDCGLRVVDAQLCPTPDFLPGAQRFTTASPVLVKHQPPELRGPADHLPFDDPRTFELLTRTLHRKLEQAGLPTTGASVSFDRSYPQARTKLVHYKETGLKANACPVIVTGSSEQIGFAWNVGVGHSTGIGMGSLQ